MAGTRLLQAGLVPKALSDDFIDLQVQCHDNNDTLGSFAHAVGANKKEDGDSFLVWKMNNNNSAHLIRPCEDCTQ